MTDHHDAARGRWASILPQLGVPSDYLTGRHGPCPKCGGTDRFRFDDQLGKGTYYCSKCGSGTGFDLVMLVNGLSFIDAKKAVLALVESAPVLVRKASHKVTVEDEVKKWRQSVRLNGYCAASKYLQSRGILLTEWPAVLRIHEDASYWTDDGKKLVMPAMMALYVSPDMSKQNVHYTFLTPDGQKADVPKQKKNGRGPMPKGGAVRLAPSAETMGIAEGIETALSAAQLNGIPVWAALNSGLLVNWQPPPTAKNIIIFGDSDSSYGGQSSAYGLAYRLKTEGYHVEVRVPDTLDCDWNDMLMSYTA